MLLAWLILIPLIGGLLCWQSDRFGNLPPRWIALASMSLVMYLSLDLWASGNYSLATDVLAAPQWQMELQIPWIPAMGISIHLALDGLSLTCHEGQVTGARQRRAAAPRQEGWLEAAGRAAHGGHPHARRQAQAGGGAAGGH